MANITDTWYGFVGYKLAYAPHFSNVTNHFNKSYLLKSIPLIR